MTFLGHRVESNWGRHGTLPLSSELTHTCIHTHMYTPVHTGNNNKKTETGGSTGKWERAVWPSAWGLAARCWIKRHTVPAVGAWSPPLPQPPALQLSLEPPSPQHLTVDPVFHGAGRKVHHWGNGAQEVSVPPPLISSSQWLEYLARP